MDNGGKILSSNANDNLAMITKSIMGIIPYGGTFLGELISGFIPNQRIDRISHYLETVSLKVNSLQKELKEDIEAIHLIESGFVAASQAEFIKKCEWFGNVVKMGLENVNNVNLYEKYIKIIKELDYEQIIILYFYVNYYTKSLSDKQKYINRFPNLLGYDKYFSKDRSKYEELKERYRINISFLVRLLLIEKDEKISEIAEISLSRDNEYRNMEYIQKQIIDLSKKLTEIDNSESFKPTRLGTAIINAMLVREENLNIL